ncbi:MAG: cystathionine gamma-synthase [Alphaproteobacteria bacterium]|nr:cystathionine gamma-synthase [Alphaproteobacteria bacterium]
MVRGFDTCAIHARQAHDPATGAVITPIYATSTYAQEAPGIHKGFDYGRSHNPTRFAFEGAIAALEGGAGGFAFASGMAAEAAVLELLEPGSHIVTTKDVYGGTHRLFERVRRHSAKLSVTYTDLCDPAALGAVIKPETRMIWVESPSNPLLRIVDLAAIADQAKKRNILTVVDNTFASPWVQKPLDLGMDIVVHSATKYIGGHSDVVGGVAVAARQELADKIGYIQNAVGSIAGPFDSFLMHRGLKTLGVRMQRHCENAMKLAAWLESRPEVGRVFYPGLASHPQHALAKKQMRHFGGMISIELKGSRKAAEAMLKKCKLFTLAISLGGIESLIEYPAAMSHAVVPAAAQKEMGMDEGLVRLSVGIEDVHDLQADLEQALKI